MATVDDRRETKKAPWAFVVFTDKLLSGWGGAKNGRSLIAFPVEDRRESEVVLANGGRRGEMKRGRLIMTLRDLKRSAKPGDHLSIRDRDDASRWYTPNGF